MARVLAFGTFDLLHQGHRFFLGEAKKLGTELVVVVARDESVLEIKGRRPLHSEQQRLASVEQLSFVDKAVLGKEISKRYEIVLQLKPDIIALGYDQKPSEAELRRILDEMGLQPAIVRVPAFNEKEFKSSRLRESLT